MNCQYHPFQGSTIYVAVNYNNNNNNNNENKKAVHIFTENYSE
jgi:hypothetical protein